MGRYGNPDFSDIHPEDAASALQILNAPRSAWKTERLATLTFDAMEMYNFGNPSKGIPPGQARWLDLARLASDVSIHGTEAVAYHHEVERFQEWLGEARKTPQGRADAWRHVDALYTSGHLTDADRNNALSTVGEYPDAFWSRRAAVHPSQRKAFDDDFKAQAKRRGISTFELNQALTAEDRKVGTNRPNMEAEAKARGILNALRVPAAPGVTAQRQLKAILSMEAEGKGLGPIDAVKHRLPLNTFDRIPTGTKQMPFEGGRGQRAPEDRLRILAQKVLATPYGQGLARQGFDVHRYLGQVMGETRGLAIQEGLAQRFGIRDANARNPLQSNGTRRALPQEVRLDSRDRYAKTRRDTIAALVEQREGQGYERPKQIGSSMEYHLRSAMADHEGKSRQEFNEEHSTPSHILERVSEFGEEAGTGTRWDDEEDADYQESAA